MSVNDDPPLAASRYTVLLSSIGLISLCDALLYVTMTHGIALISPFENVAPAAGSEPLYAALRLLHVGFLVAAQLSAGNLLLRFARLHDIEGKDPLRRFILDFVCGAAALRVLFFVAGLAGSLNWSVVAGTFVLLIVFANRYSPLRTAIFVAETLRQPRRILPELIIAFVLALTFWFLWVRIGLLPTDGDYLSHYAQYLLVTTANGRIAPNDVWYHFFYSKGDSIGMAAILATDGAGKLDASITYLIAAAACLFQVMRLNRMPTQYAVLAVTLLFYVIGAADIGAASKHHLYLLFAIIVLLYCLLGYSRAQIKTLGRDYLFGIASALLLVVFVSPPAAIFAGAILGIYTLWSLLRREWRSAAITIWMGLSLCAMLAGLLAYNYAATGLYEINPNRLFFSLANIERLKDWVSPYLITYLEQGSDSSFGQIGFHFDELKAGFFEMLRWAQLENGLTPPVALPSFLLFFIYLVAASKSRSQRLTAALAIGTVLVSLFVLLVSGHQTSAIRATAFLTPLIVYGAVIGLATLEWLFGNISILYYFVYRWTLIATVMIATLVGLNIDRFASAGMDYALGRADADEYYSKTSLSLPGTKIVVNLRQQYGSNLNILALNLIANEFGRGYLMRPGIKSEVSYALGTNWHKIALAQPDEAFTQLSRQADIVLINLESVGIGLIGFSPVMAPNYLREHFKVVMSLNNWRALAPMNSQLSGQRLSEADIASWRHARETSQFGTLAERMKAIYAYNKGAAERWPTIPENLPIVRGWQ